MSQVPATWQPADSTGTTARKLRRATSGTPSRRTSTFGTLWDRDFSVSVLPLSCFGFLWCVSASLGALCWRWLLSLCYYSTLEYVPLAPSSRRKEEKDVSVSRHAELLVVFGSRIVAQGIANACSCRLMLHSLPLPRAPSTSLIKLEATDRRGKLSSTAHHPSAYRQLNKVWRSRKSCSPPFNQMALSPQQTLPITNNTA